MIAFLKIIMINTTTTPNSYKCYLFELGIVLVCLSLFTKDFRNLACSRHYFWKGSLIVAMIKHNFFEYFNDKQYKDNIYHLDEIQTLRIHAQTFLCAQHNTASKNLWTPPFCRLCKIWIILREMIYPKIVNQLFIR